MKNILGAIAILATGVVHAEAAPVTEYDCANRAQAAYAVAVARDSGKEQQKIINRNQPVEQRATLKRIVFNVYTSSTTPDAAYSSEKSKCQSEIWHTKK